MKKRLIKWGVILVGILGSGFFIWGWTETSRILAPRKDYSQELFSKIGFCSFQVNVKGEKVQVWFLPGSKNAAIILSPGYGGNSITFLENGFSLELIERLQKKGFNLILFDPRGTGKSEGKYYLFGANQDEDILEIVRFFREKIRKFFIIGFSAGANAAILAQIKNPIDIKGVIADSPFLASEKTPLYHTLKFKILKVFALLKVKTLNFLKEISLEKVEPENVFYIVGEKDKISPPSHSQVLFEKTKGHRQIWIVKDADHCQAVFLYPTEYLEKILNFLNELEGPF